MENPELNPALKAEIEETLKQQGVTSPLHDLVALGVLLTAMLKGAAWLLKRKT